MHGGSLIGKGGEKEEEDKYSKRRKLQLGNNVIHRRRQDNLKL
jgi:hypothetical protein